MRAEEKVLKAGATRLQSCDCRSAHQDQLYGVGVRVHNLMVPGQRDDRMPARCSVCGTVKR